jgi:hybrid cluster-associated redox disulfide protein
MNMDASICAKWTVADVLATYPQTATIFLSLRTNCVGCHLARFCTLEDVARTYELSIQDLIEKLQETTQVS